MPITFRCSACAQVLKVADKLAGSRGKCPKCGAALQVPAAAEPVEEPAIANEPAPSRRSAVVAVSEASTNGDALADLAQAVDQSRGSSPKSKRKKKPVLLLSLIGGGCFGLLVVCCGGGGLAWWLFFSASVEDELKFMPSNCQLIVSIRAEQTLDSEAFQQLSREWTSFNRQKKNFTQEVGLSVEDVEHLVIGASADSDHTVAVLRTRKAVDAQELRSRIKNSKYKEMKVGKYVMQEGESNLQAFCVVDRKRIVFGDKKAVQAVLERDKKPEFSKNMQLALKQANFSNSVVVAADTEAENSLAGTALVNNFGLPSEISDSMKKTVAVTAQVKFSSDVRFEITLFCKDAAAANNVKKVYDDVLDHIRVGGRASKDVEEMMDLHLKVDGNKVTGKNTFKADPLIQMLVPSKRKRPGK